MNVSIQDLENAISKLPAAEFHRFATWFDEYRADLWDQQIEADANAGRLDELARAANAEFDSGD